MGGLLGTEPSQSHAVLYFPRMAVFPTPPRLTPRAPGTPYSEQLLFLLTASPTHPIDSELNCRQVRDDEQKGAAMRESELVSTSTPGSGFVPAASWEGWKSAGEGEGRGICWQMEVPSSAS